ncbi:MAG TPA: GNAT family N-acetyltransferase [Mycobacteriales bacterium]|nr:GNAT family N-acetyltransferase [Mycobacteriales bacterium]
MADRTRRVPFDETWLDTTAGWLADESFAALIEAGSFDPERQRAWYDSLAGRTDYVVWGIEHDGRRVGVMGLKHLDAGDGGAEYFMYLGDRSAWGHGIGRWATEEILAEGRARGLEYVYGLVGTHNHHSREVHEHLGFEVVAEEDGHWRLVQRV